MINVALLGFGRIGQMHAKNINKNKDLRLLYVYEKVDQLSKKAKHLYNCKIQTNYNKIFSDKDVDIIFISSPTNTHIKFIEEGMKFKKTIFCEKPLDLNIDKIIKTFKKVKKLRPKIQLGFNRRYDPGHFSIKRDLVSNKIGKLEGWGRTSVENLKYSINDKKNISLERFIYALGIRHIGLENAKLLSKYFGSFSKFKDLSKNSKYDDLLNIDGIGETQVNSIRNFFVNKTNLNILNELAKTLTINNAILETKNGCDCNHLLN